MFWNKKYNYPTSSRATEDGVRRYLLGEENENEQQKNK